MVERLGLNRVGGKGGVLQGKPPGKGPDECLSGCLYREGGLAVEKGEAVGRGGALQ